MRQRDAAPAARVLDAAVLRELIAAPERHDHPSRLEEDDVVVRLGAGRPAERLVEGARPGEIADAERDEAEALLHVRRAYAVRAARLATISASTLVSAGNGLEPLVGARRRFVGELPRHRLARAAAA